MNDANGGEGKLRGLVQNVPLNCGGINTQANLFVGDHMPFSLLLGRPWQRGNYVSIDKQKDGTWLLFKDPQNLEVQYELLCTPNRSNPNWDFEPSTWISNMSESTYYCGLDKNLPNLDSFGQNHPKVENSQHMTQTIANVLHTEQNIRSELVSNVLTYSDKVKSKQIQKSIKEVNELSPCPMSFGLASASNSVRHPQTNNTSFFGIETTSTNVWTMPDHVFDETCAELADFLFQNTGNFRFTTTIHNDALTLLFQPSPFSPLIDPDESTPPSPSYSPVQWDRPSTSLEDSIVVPAEGPIPAGNLNQCATSLDSGLGSLLTEDTPRQAYSDAPELTGTSREERDELEEDILQEEENGKRLSLYPTQVHSQYQVKVSETFFDPTSTSFKADLAENPQVCASDAPDPSVFSNAQRSELESCHIHATPYPDSCTTSNIPPIASIEEVLFVSYLTEGATHSEYIPKPSIRDTQRNLAHNPKPSNSGATHHLVPNSANPLEDPGIALADAAVPEYSGGSSKNYNNQVQTNNSYPDSSTAQDSQSNNKNSECLQVLGFYDTLNMILAHAAQQDEEEENGTQTVNKD
jgi:hypothetical protein